MEEKKRELVQVFVSSPVWVTPLISVITLPAHGQTSACSALDLVGNWQLTIETQGTINIELFTDGSTSNGRYRYSFDETIARFLLNEDVGDVIYIGTLGVPCTAMSGIADLIDLTTGAVIGTRMWSMVKV